MMTGALIVFAKPPMPGRVKTRLVPELTNEEAAALYEAFLEDALEQYASLDTDVRLYVAETGLNDTSADAIHPHAFRQSGHGLGERMLRAFADTFREGYDRVAIVGTDHPTLPTAFIEQAFEQLRPRQTVVLGPTEDGGFYLLGMNDLRPELFRDMTYSHERVFEETLDRASSSGATVAILPPWYDVDTPAELRRLATDLAAGGIDAPRTRRMLDELSVRYEALRPD